MEFHESFNPTRPYGLPWSSSPGLYISPSTLLEPHQSSPEFVSTGCSTGSFYTSSDTAYDPFGISPDAQASSNSHREKPRKRRKLNSRRSSPSGSGVDLRPLYTSCAMAGPVTHVAKSEKLENGYGGRHGSSSSLVSAMGSPSGALAAWELGEWRSLLCPCCSVGLGNGDGYQPVPASAPVFYGAEQPYLIEALPSVQSQAPATYRDSSMAVQSRNLPSGGQSHLKSFSSQGYVSRDLSILSTSSDGGDTTSYQTSPGKTACKVDPSGSIEPPTVSERSPLREARSIGDGSATQQHSAQKVNNWSSAPLYRHGEESPPEAQHLQYSVMPSGSGHGEPFRATSKNIPLNEDKPSFEILQPNQRGGKRGPFKDPSLREQTAQTRRMGSCIRCRMQRIRCEHNSDDPLGACLTCKKVVNMKAGRFPCLRYKISDVRLYKAGQVPGYEWTKRWVNAGPDPIQKWASSEVKMIHVSEGYSDHTLKIHVREFIPQEGDKLTRTWSHGGHARSVSVPPYALVDLEDGKDAYMTHIHESMNQAFGNILGRLGGLLYKTYQQTLRCCKDRSTPMESVTLLRDTFRLWMSIRFSTQSCFIVGEETLGMPVDILDDTSPTPGRVPLPPVLGAQLDLILIHDIQTRLRRQVLERLEKMVSKRKHNTWMVTYLVTFVLLHNTALITAHDASYARKHGMNRRFAREDKVREYHLGANILLAHFHYCNKGVHPFSDDCKDEDLRTLACLGEDQIQFIHATRNYVRRQRAEWERIRARGDYENDYFFVSQLFEEIWQPRVTL